MHLAGVRSRLALLALWKEPTFSKVKAVLNLLQQLFDVCTLQLQSFSANFSAKIF